MTWVMVLLWSVSPVVVMGVPVFGASTVVGFASKDLCEAAMHQHVVDLEERHGFVFSARCDLQQPAEMR